MQDSDFKTPRQCGDADGGHLRAAVRKGTSEVWTSQSVDGVNWDDWSQVTDEDGEAILIEVGATDVAPYQEHPAGSTRFVITNGGGFMIKSDAYAAPKSWSSY